MSIPPESHGAAGPGIALYIHFPFCRRKCSYCSFVSFEGREARIPAYVEALKRELALRSRAQRVQTVYFGGGTPSLVPQEYMRDVLRAVRSLFPVDDAAEVTMEANPGTVDEAYLCAVREMGVNRLSLGVQSLDDGELALLGRLHSSAEARDAVRFARRAGFANLSLDIIYGLPGQTTGAWKKTLDGAVALAPEHLSLYALSLEDGVPLRSAIERGEVPAVYPDLAADQYELAEELLARNGYGHYEISNWARAGFECRHNLVYWRNTPYLGIGVVAHSYLEGRRQANSADLDDYLDTGSWNGSAPLQLDEEIGSELELSESAILGLRLTEGLDLNHVKRRFGVDLLTRFQGAVEDLTALGLLERAGGRLKLTGRGRLLGNEVFWRFLPAGGMGVSPISPSPPETGGQRGLTD